MMDEKQEKLLKDVMAADFTVIDLNLYLDTHPMDQRTIVYYNNCVQRAKMLRETYERTYSPLTAFTPYNRYPWQWIDSPWPWENMEREV